MRDALRCVVVLGALGVACARPPAPDGLARGPTPAVATDSVLGDVAVVGTAADPMLVLRDRAGQVVRLVDGPEVELRAADGLTVWARGVWLAAATDASVVGLRSLRVVTFTAVASDGIPVRDGILTIAADGAASLQVGTQSHPIAAALPAALRSAHGARIYWAGPLTAPPLAYGILRPAAASR
jgi:hypothetical protein